METSTTSSIISSLGGGSGVDMVQLASDLSAARYAAKVDRLESQSELLETRISSASELKNLMTGLAGALGDRIRNGDLSPRPEIGNASVAKVSITPGSTPTGSYSLEVNALASRQQLVGKPFAAATSPVGEGTLTIRFGAISGTSFTEDTGRAALSIPVTSGQTLEDIALAINDADEGLSAYVATGADGAHLVIKGEEGAGKAFVIETTPTTPGSVPPVAGELEFLNWNPADDAGELRRSAADASFTFDGVQMTSPSNKVSGLPGELNLQLTATNIGAPTTISFADQSGNVSAVMSDFVAALNDITSALAEYADPRTGELGNDSGARALKRELSSLTSTIIMPNTAEGEPRTLSDLGLVTNRDGTFSLNDTRLNSTLADFPEETTAMFTTGLYGVFATFDSLARKVTSSSDPGMLGGSIARYTTQSQDITEKLAEIAEKQEALRTQYVKQFTWADQRVSQSQSTLTFLKNQIAAWNAQSN